MKGFKLTTYRREVLEEARRLALEELAKLAFQVEARTKVNIADNGQVDTGFMMNSVYTITPEASGYDAAQAASRAAADDRQLAPEADLGDAEAAVCVGADYAMFQEARQSFLVRAGEQVAAEVGGALTG